MRTARRKATRFGWVFAAIWLFYLAEPLGAVWEHRSIALRAYGTLVLLLFAMVYIYLFGVTRQHRRAPGRMGSKQSIAGIAGLFVLFLLLIPAAGPDSLTTFVYIAAAAMMRLRPRYGWPLVAVQLLAIVVIGRVDHGWDTGGGLVFGTFVAALAVWGVSQLVQRNIQLVAAQEEIARLAVAEERARAARDLHDILGHSLTVITVKAELAGRLMTADPGRAALEVADVESLARQALADVRGTMTAQRSVTLLTELASAGVALEAAGIDAHLPDLTDPSVSEAAAAHGELFGWVVREGVTNVVRHSGASDCHISVAPDHIEIHDDGRGPDADPADRAPGPWASQGGAGHGLRGLRERAAAAGAVVSVGRVKTFGGFRLVVTVPGDR